jgi:integrative and conjugative element protein (TIGR02256 family)
MLQQDFITIQLPKNELVIMPTSVLTRLYQYRQLKFWHREKGGIFLGRYRGQYIEVTDITLPQHDDICGRFFFNRCSPLHQQTAYTQWQNSSSEITYVGEWHTHPEQIPNPSTQDITEWQSKLSGSLESMLLCIIGQSTDWFGVFKMGLFQSKQVQALPLAHKTNRISIKRDGVCNPVPNVFTVSELRDFI